MRERFRAISRSASRVGERFQIAFSTGAGLFLVFTVIRVLTWRGYLHTEVHAFDFDPRITPLPVFLGNVRGDFRLAVIVSLMVAALEKRIGRKVALASASILGVAVVLVATAHFELIFTMGTGLNWTTIAEFLSAPSWGEVHQALLGPLILLPIAGLAGPWAAAAIPGFRKTLAAFSSTALVAVTALSILHPRGQLGQLVRPPLLQNGFLYALHDVRTHLFRHTRFDREGEISEAQAGSVALIDDVFRKGLPPIQPVSILHRKSNSIDGRVHPHNVVLLILESTHFEQAEGERPDGTPLMKNLQVLKKMGVNFTQHRSPANSSASAFFSILTGLYPMPEQTVFAIRNECVFPGMPKVFGTKQDSFLVTPGRLESFFPGPLLRRNSLEDLLGYYQLPPTPSIPNPALISRNENASFEVFEKKLRHARGPFFAAYYSFVPHFYYFDYGQKYRVFPGASNLERYRNNLVLLDELIGRTVDALRDTGKLNDTVLIIVGDHGEAFGQHSGNYAHSRGSFEENFRVPFLLIHPDLVPGEVNVPTSHVDILPTLLDLERIPYDPGEFEGESLLRPYRARRLFGWGNEGTLTVWRPEGPGPDPRDGRVAERKVQILLDADQCRVFDLAADASESRSSKCGPEVSDDIAAIYAWRRQQGHLKNESLKRFAEFQPGVSPGKAGTMQSSSR